MSNEMIPDISCSICLGIYDIPKVLFCGHSFCKTCILRIVNANDHTVRCPKCRVTSFVPNGLTTNFAMNHLVEQTCLRNTVTVEKQGISAEMESTAKGIVWKAVNDNNNNQRNVGYDIAKAIINKFKTIYGGCWHCIVSDINMRGFGFDVDAAKSICLEVENSGKRIYLFKSGQDKPCWKCDSVSCDGTKCKLPEPQIDEWWEQMSGEMVQDAKQVAMRAIKEQTSPESAADFIKDHFDQTMVSIGHVILPR